MDLQIGIQASHLVVTIVNSSPQPLRLWDWANSWGWYSLAIEVRGPVTQIEFRHKSREWTKNGPDYFTLQPRESREVLIDLHDGWWEADFSDSAGAGVDEIPSPLLELRVRLQIPPTPESAQFDIFTGTASSEWITSTPPHFWLSMKCLEPPPA